MKSIFVALVPRLAVVAGCLFSPCYGADPGKDPNGWGELKFGMNAKQVVDALGVEVFIEEAKPEQHRPFRSGDTIDIPAALAFAKEKIAAENENKGGDVDVLEAAKKLRVLLKTRGWSYSEADNPYAPPSAERRKPPSKVTATLESFIQPPGPMGPIGSQIKESQIKESQINRIVVLRLSNKKASQPVNLSARYIDQKSKDYIREVEAAVEELAALVMPRQDQPDPNPNHINPATIRARVVTVRGITLQPGFSFNGESLAEVRLHSGFAGEGANNFDHWGMHRTLCEALTEKYGKADEDNDTPVTSEKIWRFPKTVLRCRRYEVTFPGSSFVRKGVSITYEVPSETNVSGDDKM